MHMEMHISMSYISEGNNVQLFHLLSNLDTCSTKNKQKTSCKTNSGLQVLNCMVYSNSLHNLRTRDLTFQDLISYQGHLKK